MIDLVGEVELVLACPDELGDFLGVAMPREMEVAWHSVYFEEADDPAADSVVEIIHEPVLVAAGVMDEGFVIGDSKLG